MTRPIYEVIIENLDNIKTPGYLRNVLREYNLHNLFRGVYEMNEKIEDANFLICFIILNWSNKCKWIMTQKDSMTVRLEIINSILIDSNLEVSEEVQTTAINSNSEFMKSISNMYMGWQKSSDFASLMALLSHISTCNRLGINPDTNTLTDIALKNRTDMYNKLEETKLIAQEIQNRIEKEYSTLDEHLKKEGRMPISKDIDITDYESRLLGG